MKHSTLITVAAAVGIVVVVPMVMCAGCFVIRTGTANRNKMPTRAKVVDYDEKPDEFGSATERLLTVRSDDMKAALVVTRKAGTSMEVRLMSTDVLFPDDASRRGMRLSVTFKFDTQSEASQSFWHMNIMKYSNAWYEGDSVEFANEVFRANRLSLKTDKRGDVYRFDLIEARQFKDRFFRQAD